MLCVSLGLAKPKEKSVLIQVHVRSDLKKSNLVFFGHRPDFFKMKEKWSQFGQKYGLVISVTASFNTTVLRYASDKWSCLVAHSTLCNIR